MSSDPRAGERDERPWSVVPESSLATTLPQSPNHYVARPGHMVGSMRYAGPFTKAEAPVVQDALNAALAGGAVPSPDGPDEITTTRGDRMSTETIAPPLNPHSRTNYVEHFNRVVSNYVEALLETPRSTERHQSAARGLDVLMAEYALAADLLDQVRGDCWGEIEKAKNQSGMYEAIGVAEKLSGKYPMLKRALFEFASDLKAAG